MLTEIRAEMRQLADAETARKLRWFFKAEPGGYGEGDAFLGIRVPQQRSLAKHYVDMPQRQVHELLHSRFHEHRLTALLILVLQYARSDATGRREIYDLYLDNTAHINNWDLVDSSAPQIVGEQLVQRSRRPLDRLARSENLWERRIAILATLAFIKRDDHVTTLRIAARLVQDEHDLIHKAVGWMLREVGNRDRSAEEGFLDQHAAGMPRTMLRYAIEKFPARRRQHYMRLGRTKR